MSGNRVYTYDCLCGCGTYESGRNGRKFYKRSCYNTWRRQQYILKPRHFIHCLYCEAKVEAKNKQNFCPGGICTQKYYQLHYTSARIPKEDGVYIVTVVGGKVKSVKAGG